MGQVNVITEREVGGSEQAIRVALADYADTRPKILTDQFSGYEVRAGGQGAGTSVQWKFAATSKRVRDQLIQVTEPGDGTLVETDANSTMVTTWTVRPSGPGRVVVGVHTTWDGAGGIGGVFERIFAPKGLGRVYDEMIGKLDGLSTS